MGNVGRQRLQAALRGQRLPDTHDSSVGKQALPGVAALARARTRPIPKKQTPGFGHEEGGREEGDVAGLGLPDDARRCGLGKRGGKERVWNEAAGRRRAGRGVSAGVSRACGTARRRDGRSSALRTDEAWSRGKRRGDRRRAVRRGRENGAWSAWRRVGGATSGCEGANGLVVRSARRWGPFMSGGGVGECLGRRGIGLWSAERLLRGCLVARKARKRLYGALRGAGGRS